MTFIGVVLVAAIGASGERFESYKDLARGGFYYSPGYDCEVSIPGQGVVFTATYEEDRFAIFVKGPQPISVVPSGYEVRRVSDVLDTGQHVTCRKVEDGVVVVEWTHDSEPGSGPSHQSFLLAPDASGKWVLSTCGWGFEPLRVARRDGRLFARFGREDGGFDEVDVSIPRPDCADPRH
jgi:hypothetical protein